jgi:hypothetical protein
MDPAIQALTIGPADWAALLGGFVEGLGYDVGILVCIAVLGAALCTILGRRGVSAVASGDDRDAAAWQPAPLSAVQPEVTGRVVLVASGPYAVWLGHRQHRCARRRVSRRAAAPVSFGPLPF